MKFLPVIFAICTALCWGMYGPTIGNAQSKVWSPFKPYVFIGVAYLVLAVGGGLVGMQYKGDHFSFFGDQFAATKWGFLAGCLGAAGALFLTSAMMTSKGNALLVMPIVFGGAVSVTALFSIWRLRAHDISPLLYVGIGMVVVGVILVAKNTPHGHPAKKTESVQSAEPAPSTAATDSEASPYKTPDA